MNTIKEVCKSAYQTAKEKGFHDKPINIGEKLMLITSELGEALEAHRNGKVMKIEKVAFDGIVVVGRRNTDTDTEESFVREFPEHIKDTFEDELADACIRLFDLAESQGIDLEFHILSKMKFNKSRERLHGKNY